jgi:phospholipid/cholesterol/gamma-HCH transport system permease protein
MGQESDAPEGSSSEIAQRAGAPSLVSRTGAEAGVLVAGGRWTVDTAADLEALVDRTVAALPERSAVSVDMSAITAFDTYGAWLLARFVAAALRRQVEARVTALPERYLRLFDAIGHNGAEPPKEEKRGWIKARLVQLGEVTIANGRDLLAFANMLGALSVSAGRTLVNPRSFRLTSTVHHVDRVGWQAIPIILLITFLIGTIIAQQGIFHFRKFGADVYVVDMVGILVLREIGVLIVAIMIAGRSGSAYTAELGSMKMREEIDALRTMGRDPIDVLVLPRVIALVIALPVLTFLGSMAALYGGGLVAWLYGGMSPEIYLSRLREAVSLTHLKVGLIKAPFMALVIGVVAATQGLAVKGSAESLGRETTASVVKSIFLVIVLDGLFAVFFASIDM